MRLVDTTFHALNDATRRAVLDLLRHGPASVSDLLECFEMTQPAVSQHLRVLREAGLVRVTKRGRYRMYALNAQSLHPAFDWLSQYKHFWTGKLTQLGEHLRKSKG